MNVLPALQATLDERAVAITVARQAVRDAKSLHEARVATREVIWRRIEHAVAKRVIAEYLSREIAGMLEAAFAA